MSYQSITIVGRLGKEPELRYTPDGKPVTSLSVAVDDGWGENKATAWFRVSVWGKQAEACNTHLSKGRMVLVEGRLVIDKTTGGPRMFDRNDGSKGASFEVDANTVKFIGGGDKTAAQAAPVAQDDLVIPF